MAFGSVGSVDALVATVSQYLFAPATADHVNVGFVAMPVALFVGPERVVDVRREEPVAVVKLNIGE